MHNRIKTLRKDSGLSQTTFGEKLGVSRDVINNIENGRVEPKPLILKHICSVFGVNEHWLRTGEGEKSIQTDSALLEELAAEYNMSEKQKKIIATFAAMDEKKREVLAEAFFEFVDALASSPDVSATIATRPAASDNNATREDVHRLIDQEFDAKEKGQTLSASTTTNGLGEKLA